MSHLSLEFLRQYVRDFVCHHLVRLRRSKDLLNLAQDSDGLKFSQTGLAVDSVELVYLAGLFADAVGLREFGIEDLLLASPTVQGWGELLQKALQRGLSHWGFYSSGTEGKPKLILHPIKDLEEEVLFLGKRLSEHRIERVVSLVPSHHIYGFLWSILFPHLFERAVVHPTPNFSQFHDFDLIIATPFLIKLWKNRELLPPQSSLVLVSTAPFDEELAQWLDQHNRCWFEIYGSTETAGIGFRQKTSRGFELFPYWKIANISYDQCVLIRNEKTYPLPDFVEVSQNTVRPIRRRDGALSIGGVNVSLQQVQQLLESIPGVAQAFVRSFERDDGPRLKAWIVARPNQDKKSLEKSVRDFCSVNLLSVEQPVSLTVDEQPPVNAYGKLVDW